MNREIRLTGGDLVGREPLEISAGATVGVVLLGPGGPASGSEIGPYLYRVLMDPAASALPGRAWVRHAASRLLARRRSAGLESGYEAIGGRPPVVRHASEQAAAVGSLLRRLVPEIPFRAYVAMRYGEPTTEEALDRMADDGVGHAVLVPLYPQYAVCRTGSSLAYWAAASRNARRAPKASVVAEYGEDPLFVQAVSERMDEALQRFPRAIRPRVRTVFAAHGGSLLGRAPDSGGYCCRIHRTVDAVMRARGFDRPFEVAFQAGVGLGRTLTPLLDDRLVELAREGHREVLVVPISIVTEQFDVAYRLEVATRRHATAAGITRFEVAAPLNCHPLLIETLARVVGAQVRLTTPADGPGLPPLAPPRADRAVAPTGEAVRTVDASSRADGAVAPPGTTDRMVDAGPRTGSGCSPAKRVPACPRAGWDAPALTRCPVCSCSGRLRPTV